MPLTSDYGPYKSTEQACKWVPDNAIHQSNLSHDRLVVAKGRGLQLADGSNVQLYTLDDWGYVGPQDGVAVTNAFKAAMMTYGPVSVCMDASSSTFNNYSGVSGPGGSIDNGLILRGFSNLS